MVNVADAERGAALVEKIAVILNEESDRLQIFAVLMLVLGLVRCGIDLDELCTRVRYLAKELHKTECPACHEADRGQVN